MRRHALLACAVLLAATIPAGAQDSRPRPRLEVRDGIHAVTLNPAVHSGDSTRVLALPPHDALDKKHPPHVTVFPNFKSAIKIGNKSYPFSMVGANPFLKGAKPATITVPIIPVILTFSDGYTLDPTTSNDCTGALSAVDAVLGSPIFQDVDWGEGVGRQYVEQVRRWEFWSYTGPGKLNAGYSVRIAPLLLDPITVPVDAAAGHVETAHCGALGHLQGDALEAFLHSQVFPQFPKVGINATMFPVFLFLSTVVDFGDLGTAAGYHSAVSTGGQTYGVMMYDAAAESPARSGDVSVISHEVAEWYDDPWVNNPTPAWGHTGQVSGCQGNLEVGDPLTGRLMPAVPMGNGMTYHVQELAFFSWFFGQSPSLGVGGLYSSNGTFTTAASPCSER
jgi:hypothetical protein